MRNMLWVDGGWNRVGGASLACVLSSNGVQVWSFRFVRESFRFVRWVLGEFKQWVTLIGLCGRGGGACNRRWRRLRRFCGRSRRRTANPSPAPDDPSHLYTRFRRAVRRPPSIARASQSHSRPSQAQSIRATHGTSTQSSTTPPTIH